MAENKSEILQGTPDLVVLKTLTAMGPLPGYGIARRIGQISEQALEINQGTIYASLVRLQHRGWISAVCGSSGNQRGRKFCDMTEVDRKRLSEEAATWERISGVMGRVPQMAERS